MGQQVTSGELQVGTLGEWDIGSSETETSTAL
jgi:hypothetical protein